MANRGDVVSVDKLWDIFDRECEKAWEGVDAPIGSSEWNIAAGKIDTINNICEAVHGMNTCSRSDWEKYEYTCRDVVPARHGPCMGSDRKMTNADMIRSMSDEELAEIFCVADWCNACGQLKQDGTCHAMEMGGPLHPYCKAGCLTWLRQSAVEEAR